MKTILKFLILIYFITCFFSCANKEKMRDNISRGIYEESNRMQEMEKDNGPPLPPDQKSPTFDQYKRERQEILKEGATDQQQQ
ncbi:MAG: hypothetical protein WAU91_11820 [Desulfatitalea sp.]